MLENRIALITGASRGIGRALALDMARAGAHVVLLARTKGALEEIDDEIRDFGGTATLLPLNLRHNAKVDKLGPSLFERWGRLDILVANAGILGPLSPLGHISDHDWEDVMQINVTANWRLIRTLDPLLRKSDAGRAVFMTSNAPRGCRAYWGPYTTSKAALEALVKTYANELANTPVRVNLFNPGKVATAMRAKAYPGEDQATLTQPHQLTGQIMAMVNTEFEKNGEIINYNAE